MNRLVSAPSRPIFSTRWTLVAAVLWQLAPLPASAQLNFPSPPTVPPSAETKSVAGDSIDGLLSQARGAIDSKDYYAAVQAFRKASATPGVTPAQAAGIQQLRLRFSAIGIDEALLSLPAAQVPTPPQEAIEKIQRRGRPPFQPRASELQC